MATTEIKIANMALTHLGAKRITAVDNTTKQGRLIVANWDLLVDICLEARPWIFAQNRGAVAAFATAETGYDYAYNIPADCIGSAVNDILNDDGLILTDEYVIEQGKILTNSDDIAYVRYTQRINNVGKWPPLFVNAFAYKMAETIALAVSDNTRRKEDMAKLYERALRQAGTANARRKNKPNQYDYTDTWINARK